MDEDQVADGITILELERPEGCELVPAISNLGPGELDWIGRELREFYDSVLREPVPVRLLALLDQGLARRTFH